MASLHEAVQWFIKYEKMCNENGKRIHAEEHCLHRINETKLRIKQGLIEVYI